MKDEGPHEREGYMSGTSGGSASSPTREEELSMGPIASGAIVSSIVALLIGWIPLVGAFVAGFVGGWIARTRIRGLYATFVAGVIAMMWFWFVTYLPDLPFAWASRLTDVLAPIEFLLSGASAIVFSLVLMGAFLLAIVGGWVGGLLRERREHRSAMHSTARPF